MSARPIFTHKRHSKHRSVGVLYQANLFFFNVLVPVLLGAAVGVYLMADSTEGELLSAIMYVLPLLFLLVLFSLLLLVDSTENFPFDMLYGVGCAAFFFTALALTSLMGVMEIDPERLPTTILEVPFQKFIEAYMGFLYLSSAGLSLMEVSVFPQKCKT